MKQFPILIVLVLAGCGENEQAVTNTKQSFESSEEGDRDPDQPASAQMNPNQWRHFADEIALFSGRTRRRLSDTL